MSCLDVRRLLLAAPREARGKLRTHLRACEDCRRLDAEIARLDSTIETALLTPAPPALAERILVQSQRRGRYALAIATTAVLILTAAALLVPQTLGEKSESVMPIAAVGPAHPAVQAIALVVEREAARLESGFPGDPRNVAIALEGLGLSLSARELTVQYAGQCLIGRGRCEHVVVGTPDGFVSVILLPEEPLSQRVIVADRRMVALASPAATGGYILVADSPNVARRTEKLLRVE